MEFIIAAAIIILQIQAIGYLEGFVYLLSGIFSSILIALSIYAYRKRYIKKILYAVFAFVSFTIYLFFEAFENFYPTILETSYTDIAAASITTLVLIFFFLAIIKK
ncbi:MAG: hypothetical protein ACM3VV_05695 [Deltaproteobacteria bacterium]